MSFFIRGNKAKNVKRKLSKKNMADEISSESEDELGGKQNDGDQSDENDEDASETANQKRLRLAKEYLAEVQREAQDKAENEAEATSLVAQRLKQDALAESGRLQKIVADSYKACSSSDIKVLRCHKLSVTCVALSEDNQHLFSGSKDGSIAKWDSSTGQKLKFVPGLKTGLNESSSRGHKGAIFALAVSSNGAYLASGGSDASVLIWNPESFQVVKKFAGHRRAISGLAFRKNTLELFSASLDRSVKLWNLAEMCYVETMFGHQDQILDIDCLSRERPLTCGSRDRTLRAWKVAEESQLLFRAHSGCGSVDRCTLVNEDHFLSGADDGSLSLWSVAKKKPVLTKFKAHCSLSASVNGHANGDSAITSDTPQLTSVNFSSKNCCWITAVAAYKYSDLVASGSCAGFVRLWKIGSGYKSLERLFDVPIVGFVNDLAFSADGTKLVCAVGQEHKHGRWWRMKNARNSVVVISLLLSMPSP